MNRQAHGLASVGIRRARQEDANALVGVQRAALQATHSINPAPTDWAFYIGSNEHFIYLAEDEVPFGFVCAGPGADTPHGEIVGLYLRPEYWGHGMGKKLLVRGASVLKRRGYENVFLWVRSDQPRMLALMASLHFVRIDAERTSNIGANTITELGYLLTLDDWF